MIRDTVSLPRRQRVTERGQVVRRKTFCLYPGTKHTLESQKIYSYWMFAIESTRQHNDYTEREEKVNVTFVIFLVSSSFVLSFRNLIFSGVRMPGMKPYFFSFLSTVSFSDVFFSSIPRISCIFPPFSFCLPSSHFHPITPSVASE